jgi:flagellar protein FlbD
MVLNADLIVHMESTPDTVISLTNGQKLVVLEPVEEVIGRIVEFRRAIYRCAFTAPASTAPAFTAPEG